MKKALYRAFRPKTFDEVLGQDHITRILKNQIRSGNPGHAYLFAGTRGTGKTSCAKIFARAVNCLNPKDGNPCNECENCKAILDETTMDVVEMDAASNRRIDDIRELKEHVIYPPANLKYKVYIIDEAHMITKEAFNALLKIMEEPPQHLIFIMATTDPDQIPVTILSRLQQFEFKRLDMESIEKNIENIANVLGLKVEPDARHAMAMAADGAMRDALSLMDQVLSGGETEIREETVRRVLGTIGYEATDKLVRAVFSDDLRGLMQISQDILARGKDPQVLLRECVEYYRLLMLAKGLGDKAYGLPPDPFQKNALIQTSSMADMERILAGLDLLTSSEKLLKKSDFAQALVQASLVKLVNYASEDRLESRIARLERKVEKLETQGGLTNAKVGQLAGDVAYEPDIAESGVTGSAAVGAGASESNVMMPEAGKGLEPGFTEKVEKIKARENKGPEIGNDEIAEGQAIAKTAPPALLKKIEESGLFAPALFKMYKDVRLDHNNLYVIYPKASPVLGLIKDKREGIEALLNEGRSGEFKVYVGEEGDYTFGSEIEAKAKPEVKGQSEVKGLLEAGSGSEPYVEPRREDSRSEGPLKAKTTKPTKVPTDDREIGRTTGTSINPQAGSPIGNPTDGPDEAAANEPIDPTEEKLRRSLPDDLLNIHP